MRGPELGVQADDIEAPETELEPKHEVLENKDVRFALFQTLITPDCLNRILTLPDLPPHYVCALPA